MAGAKGPLLSGISIDIEEAQQIESKLKTSTILPVASAFVKNAKRVRNMVAMPGATSSGIVKAVMAGGVFWQLWKNPETTEVAKKMALETWGAIQRKDDHLPLIEIMESHKPDLQKAFPNVTNDASPDASEAAADFLQKIFNVLEKVEFTREWIEGQLAAAIAGAWTTFECVATDAWVETLNNFPSPFAHRATVAKGNSESEGFSGKQINADMISRHNFDLRRVMGSVLKPKFDLTSLKNIKTAYDAIFPKALTIGDALNEKGLALLEACRHVIVHRAGIVDNEFATKTKSEDISAVVGEPLPITGELVSRLINAGIKAGMRVLLAVDARITADGNSLPSSDEGSQEPKK